MKYDGLLLFSDAQAITSAAASTNILDLQTTTRQMGVGNELYVVTIVDVAFTDAGSNSTLSRVLETDTADSFGSATTAQTLKTIPALAAVGDVFVDKLSPFTTAERYLRVQYTPNNGDLTTGAVTTFITTTPHLWTKYAKGYTISSANQF